MPEEKILVMISSTSLDLPKQRDAVFDACQKLGMHAVWMDDLHAHDATASTASLEMVDKADIYVGIFAHRYGFVPKENNPEKISITEMEYNRAVIRGMPRAIFIIDDTQPVLPKNIQRGGAGKLKKFLKRVKNEVIVNFFTTPDDLKAKAAISLVKAAEMMNAASLPKRAAGIPDTPAPPEAYIAHPYLLLQTSKLIGRRTELDLLNEWVSDSDSDICRRHIFSFVAIGGLGKSALTWHWFNNIVPEKMKDLAGRMWWSFYDRDASVENFAIHALAYISEASLESVRKIPAPEREAKLLAALNQKPYLFVFDGFERVLNAYARPDAARVDDSAVDMRGNARKAADLRVGQFLKKLAQVKSSRILISTRIQPAELQTDTDKPLPGVFLHELESLSDDDAINLWQELGVHGSPTALLPVFRLFGKHTLLIQALAGVVVGYRRGPGNFDKWREANPQFDPAGYPEMKDRMAHVLEIALRGLDERSRGVLNTIAAFRLSTDYDTLAAVLIGKEKLVRTKRNWTGY